MKSEFTLTDSNLQTISFRVMFVGVVTLECIQMHVGGENAAIVCHTISPLVRDPMHNRNTIIFSRSLIAAAIVSLSACSTTPRMPEYDLSKVGAGILKAGRTTADVSGHAWSKTTYLLGFSDVDPSSKDHLLIDEVDLAMMEVDALLPPADATVRPIIIQNAKANRPAQKYKTPTNTDIALNSAQPQHQTPIESEDAAELLLAGNTATLIGNALPAGAIEDLVHEVSSSETLWDISKLTTGDANNWHVLADVNNLGPNASVYPGQQLIIPADMVKPAFDAETSDTQQAANDILIDTPLLTNDDVKLEIPAAPVETIEVAAVAAPEGRALKLNAGETLWDFAKRTTGDATNWKAIALQNNFSERQAVVVRPGQIIYVPEPLVKPIEPATQTAELSSPAAELLPRTPDASASMTDQSAVEASSELLTSASALDETQPIKIVEATFKAAEPLTPIAIPQIPSDTLSANANKLNEIMVSGTYYPKAIYNEADFSSSLLTRVSPGTTLQVSKVMGSWFEVTTDKGVGYVHQRDIK